MINQRGVTLVFTAILITNFLSDQLQPFPQQLRKSVGYEHIYRDKDRTTL